MTGFPGSPKLLKCGLVLLDPNTGSPMRVITLQYNPDSLSRTMQAQGMGDHADRSEALRLKGPAIETYKLEAEFDLTDQLEAPSSANSIAYGLHPQLAALEAMIQPTSSALEANNRLASVGTLEIAPVEAPLAIFVWGQSRVVPVRITDLSVTEEAFDTKLNPIRAKVSLGLRVLTVNDVGFDHRAGALFMTALRQRERIAALQPSGQLQAMGVEGVL